MREVDERIIARRREVRRSERQRRLRRTLVLLSAIVVVAALVAVERSSLVALDRVEVRGADAVAESRILAAAGLELGTSTVRLRLGAAERRVEGLALVRDATVRRADPLTVVVEVDEREPALVVDARGRQVLLDADGVVIGPADGSEGLPRVVLDAAAVGVGTTVASSRPLAAAVAVHDELPGPLRTRVSVYHADRDASVRLVLDDDTVVAFGDDERVAEKARALAAVIEDLGGRSVDEIDVRAPRAPVVVPTAPATAPVVPPSGDEAAGQG